MSAESHHTATVPRNLRLPFALIALLFLLWGLANNMNDTLLAAFRRIMSMNDLQTSLVQFAFYGAYFCMALPAALFIRKHSYKSGILLGLFTYAVGTLLFYPAGLIGSYGFFLVAIYIMAAGCAVLETTANPFIFAMGPHRSATRRLNIAQSLNPFGAIAGILISRTFILSELHEAGATERDSMSGDALRAIQQHELGAVSGTYMLIGAVLLLLFCAILFIRMPDGKADEREVSAENQSSGSVVCRLWHNRRYRYGVVAEFFYVGVQTGVWSFTIRLVMSLTGCREAEASDVFLYSILAFTGFRLIFTALMKRYRPVALMLFASIGATISTVCVILAPVYGAITALVCTSAFMSLMFPTIYGLALDTVAPADAKIGASGLIMAILGGAIITPVQALVSDRSGSVATSFIVPLVCFSVILTYAIAVNHADKRKQRTANK